MFYIRQFTPQPTIDEDLWIKDFDFQESDSKDSERRTNVCIYDNKLVIEICLCGFKKSNISVSYVGNTITVNAKWESIYPKKECECDCGCENCSCSDVKYLDQTFEHKDIQKQFNLVNDYLGSEIKWKFENGLLLIVCSKVENTETIQPIADDEGLFNE